jgi:hypothetical protein
MSSDHTEGSTKYSVPDDHWDDSEPDASEAAEPAAWRADTSAPAITIDVRLHDDGYQTDRKWTIHCTIRRETDAVIAGYGIEHQNKGNYWRSGDRWGDAVDFQALPQQVRARVSHVLNRSLEEITPDEPAIHREDDTGIADARALSPGSTHSERGSPDA